MEKIRRYHNSVKQYLIEHTVQTGDYVLDVGCGAGGDIHKWRHKHVKVDMCDPNYKSIQQAKDRLNGYSGCNIFCGDVLSCPNNKYDVICYNFSIQYIFSSKEYFENSIKNIAARIRPGGHIIGCVPNSDMILMYPNFKDSIGNFMIRKEQSTGFGSFGEKLYVQLVNTPFYKNGPKTEPIAYKDLLVHELSKYNIQLVCWSPFAAEHEISQMYSYFIFKYNDK